MMLPLLLNILPNRCLRCRGHVGLPMAIWARLSAMRVGQVWMRVKGIWMMQAWDPDGGRMRLTPANPETAERLSQRRVPCRCL